MIHIASDKTKSSLTKVQPQDVQPNAVDLRVDKIFKIAGERFYISEEAKEHRGSQEMLTSREDEWYLQVGSYEVIFENIIDVAEGEAGFVITRSTLNRNGLYLTTGLYDSGYNGVMAAVLHVTTAPAVIKKGTRLGQFLLFNSETLSMYDGDYGLDKDHDKKYKKE
tara:strand:- start:1643 stop:2140 length:498 start_codon:yes stop_codon:yes gene_type:complete